MEFWERLFDLLMDEVMGAGNPDISRTIHLSDGEGGSLTEEFNFHDLYVFGFELDENGTLMNAWIEKAP